MWVDEVEIGAAAARLAKEIGAEKTEFLDWHVISPAPGNNKAIVVGVEIMCYVGDKSYSQLSFLQVDLTSRQVEVFGSRRPLKEKLTFDGIAIEP